MKFNKRKFNFMFILTVVLICLTVGLSNVNFNGAIGSTDADGDDTIIDGGEGGDNEGDGSEGGENPSDGNEIPKLDIKLTNAWTAWYKALEMDSKYKSKVLFSQITNGNAEAMGIKVNVKASINREIYNNIDEVYVINNAKTDISVLGGMIDLGDGKNFISYSLFNLKDGNVYTPGSKRPIDDYKKEKLIMTYEIPYIITPDTVSSAYFNSDPNKNYYEINFVLNSKAWEIYQKVVQDEIGVNQLPKINSITVTAKISKTYGTFMSVVASENYTVVYEYNGIKVDVNCSGTVQMKYDYFSNNENEIEDIRNKIGL